MTNINVPPPSKSPSVTVTDKIWDGTGTFKTTSKCGIYQWIRESIPEHVYEKLEPNETYCLVTKLYKVDSEK